MTKETLGKWHRAYTENGDVDVTQKIPGMRMYNPRWLTMAKVTAKEGNRSVQCPYAKNGTIGHQKTAKNFLRKFQLFSAGVSEYPDSGCFAVLWTGGGKDMGEGLWKNDEVLLQEKRQSVTFAIEGCRRDLNGASGQTALWFDKSDICPVFVPSFWIQNGTGRCKKLIYLLFPAQSFLFWQGFQR